MFEKFDRILPLTLHNFKKIERYLGALLVLDVSLFSTNLKKKIITLQRMYLCVYVCNTFYTGYGTYKVQCNARSIMSVTQGVYMSILCTSLHGKRISTNVIDSRPWSRLPTGRGILIILGITEQTNGAVVF